MLSPSLSILSSSYHICLFIHCHNLSCILSVICSDMYSTHAQGTPMYPISRKVSCSDVKGYLTWINIFFWWVELVHQFSYTLANTTTLWAQEDSLRWLLNGLSHRHRTWKLAHTENRERHHGYWRSCRQRALLIWDESKCKLTTNLAVCEQWEITAQLFVPPAPLFSLQHCIEPRCFGSSVVNLLSLPVTN